VIAVFRSAAPSRTNGLLFGADQTQAMTPDARWEPEFLYRFEAALHATVIGLTPEGLRLTISFDGTIREGLLQGARVSGIDHYLLRSDGVGVVDTGKTLSLGDVHVYEHVRGYCVPPEGLELPPLGKLIEPDFAWPDLAFPILGSSMFRTGAAELEYLNQAIAQLEGWANFACGTIEISTYLLEP
jgi:hypothetical protein